MTTIDVLPDYVRDVTIPGMHSMPGGGLDFGNDLHPNLLQLVGEFLENFLHNVVRALFGFFPGGDTAFNLLSQWGEQLNINLTKLGDDLGTLVWRLLHEPLEVLGEIPQVLINGLEDTLSTLGNWIETIVNGIAGALGLPMVGDFIDRIFDISDELAWVQEKAGEAWEDLGILVNRLLHDPIGVIGEIPKALVNGLEDTLTTLGNWLETLVDSILGALGLPTGGDFLSKIFDLSDEFQWIQEKAGEAWEDLGELIQNLLHNPGAVLGQLTQGMVAGLDQLGRFIFGGRSVGTNLVSDPGMEDAAEWPNQAGTFSTAQRHSGTASREVTANGTNRYLYLHSDHRGLSGTDLAGMWKVQPGEKYYYEGWLYMPANTVKAGTTPRIVAGFYDSTGQNAVTTISAAGSTSWTDFVLGSWQKIKGYVTVPAGFDRMMARASINSNNTVGNVYYWDDFIVREVTESQNIVERIFGAVGDTVSQIAGFLIPNLDVTKIMRGVENLGTYLTNEATKLADLLRDLLTDPGKVIGQLTQGMVAGLDNLAAFLFGRSQAGSNLVTDPGFEKPEMWAGLVGAQVTNERARGGQRSMKVTSATSNRQFAFSQDHRGLNWSDRAGYWKVQAGEKYYVEAWVYAPSTNTFGTGTAPLIRAVYGDEKGDNALGGATIANPGWAAIQAGANGWQKWSGYFTVPAGQDLLTFIFRSEATEPAGNVYFLDDIAVREVTESQNIVARLFGAVGDTVNQIAGFLIPNLDVTKIVRGVENLGTILTNTATDIAGKLSQAIFGGYIKGGSNLATDPEMIRPELWTVNHPSTGFAISTEQSQGGTTSVKATSLQSNGMTIDLIRGLNGALDSLIVSPGQKLYVEYWMRKHADVTATRSAGLYLLASDSKGVNANVNVTAQSGTSKTVTSTGWVKVSSYFTVPAGFDRVRAIATTNSTAIGEAYYIDSPMINEVTEAQNIVERIFGGVGAAMEQIAGFLIPNLDVTKIVRGVENLGTILTNTASDIAGKLNLAIFGGRIQSGSNLVTDTEFETEIWSASGMASNASVSTEQKRSGARSIKMTGPSRSIFMIGSQEGRKDLAVEPGDKFYADCWFYLPSTNSATSNGVRIDAYYTDSTGQNATATTSLGTLAFSSTKNQWIKLSSATTSKGYFTVPAGYDRLNFRITTHSSTPSTEVVYADDFVVREVTESQNIVQRIFGAIGDTVSQIAGAMIPSLDVTKIMRGAQNLGDFLLNIPQNVISGLGDALGALLPKGLFNGFNRTTNLASDPQVKNPALWNESYLNVNDGWVEVTKTAGSSYRRLNWFRTADGAVGAYMPTSHQRIYEVSCEAKLISGTAVANNLSLFLRGQNASGALQTVGGATNFSVTTTAQTVKIRATVSSPLTVDFMPIAEVNDNNGNVVMAFRNFRVVDVTEPQNIIQALWQGAGEILTEIAGAVIPKLDVTKIMRGAQDLGTFLSNIPQNVVSGLEQLAKFLFGGQTTGTNLVVDPGFEDTAEWPTIRGAGAMSAEQKRSGSQSRKITTTTGVQAIFFAGDHRGYGTTDDRNLWKVKPGDKYYVEAWVFGAAGNVTGTGTSPRLWVNCKDTNGVATEPYLSVSAPTWAQWASAKGTWYQLSGYITVPAGCNRIRPAIEFATSEPAGNVYYVDDLMLREVTESQNIVERIFGGVGAAMEQIAGFLIPNLDVTKITRGVENLGTILTNEALRLTTLIQKLLSNPGEVIGQLTQGMVTGLGQLSKFIFGGRSVGTNLVSDPGFEDDAEWVGNTAGTQSTEQKRSGTKSRKFVANGVTNYIYMNRDHRNLSWSSEDNLWKVQPGEKYYYEAWIYAPSTNNFTTGSTPRLWAAFIDSTGALARQDITAHQPSWAVFDDVKDGWQKLSGYLTVPAGRDRMASFVQFTNTEAVGNVYYVDDLMVREVTESQNIVAKLFGSVGSALTQIVGEMIPSLDVTKIMRGAQDLGTFLSNIPRNVINGLDGILSWLRGGSSAGSNLVTDPGFEDAAAWVGISGVRSQEQKRNGNWSYKVTATGAIQDTGLTRNEAGTTYSLDVTGGDVFLVEGWVFAPASNSTTNFVRMHMACSDSSGTLSATWPGTGNVNIPKGVWTKVGGYVTIPAGYNRAYPALSVRDNTTAGNVYYWDDVVCREVTEPQNLVQRIFGAIGSTVTTILGDVIPSLDVTKIQRGVENLGTYLTNEALRLTTLVGKLLSNPGEVIGQLTQSMVGGLTNFVNWIRGAQNSGTNLVTDPSTSDPVIWSGTGLVGLLSTEYKLSGTSSLKFNGNGSGTRATYTTRNESANYRVEVQPGEKYYFEVKVLAHPSNAQTAGTIGLGAGFTDNTGTLAQTFPNARTISANTMTKGQWITLSGYVTVPAGYTLMSPRVTVNASVPASDYYYFTEFVVREVTESQNIVQRIFGAVGSTVSQILGEVVPSLDVTKIMRGAQDLGSFLSNIPRSVVQGLENFFTFIRGGQQSGSNLITDSAITSSVIWSGSAMNSVVMSTEQKRSGTHSLKHVGGAPSYTSFFPVRDENGSVTLNVNGGDKFYMEAYLWRHASNSNTGNAYFVMRCSDSSGANAQTNRRIADTTPQSTITKSQWTKVSAYFTVPEGYDRMLPYIEVHNTVPATDIFYWDDIVLREVTDSQNIVERIFGTVGSTLATILGEVIPSLDVTKIRKGVQDLGTWLNNIPKAAVDGLESALSGIDSFFQDLLQGMISAVGGIPIVGHGLSQGLTNLLNNMGILKKKADDTDKKVVRSSAANMVIDPGFDEIDLWTRQTGFTFSTAETRYGDNSLLLTSTNGSSRLQIVTNLGVTANVHTCSPGEKYYLECWVFRHSSNSNTGAIRMGLQVANSSGSFTDVYAFVTNQSTITKGVWTKVWGTVEVPTTRIRMRAFVRDTTDTATGDRFYIEDVVVREITAGDTAQTKVDGVAKNIADGWAGNTSATGTLAEVADTMAEIRTAVMAGYTVQTITSSRSWTKPANIKELIIAGLPAGANGADGAWTRSNSPNVQGGNGGVGGSYKVQALDPADVPSSVNIVIGASNGAPTTFGGAMVVITSGSVPGIATQFGYTPTVSSAGNGGKGGSVTGAWTHTHPEDGQPSPTALGGAGGTSGGTGTAGQSGNAVGGSPGFNANVAQATKCGGGGGGGGGARWHSFVGNNAAGTDGGAGGYPGGGGGGGGAAATSASGGSATPGSGGAGAAGVMWIFYK